MLRSIAIAGVIASFLVVILNFNQLPDRVPMHFDLNGEPDSYGGKWFLWFVPVITGGLYLLFSNLHRVPKSKVNYPVKVTPENESRQYANMLQMTQLLNAFLCVILAYLSWSIVNIGLGKQLALEGWLFWTILLGTFGIVGYYYWKAIQLK